MRLSNGKRTMANEQQQHKKLWLWTILAVVGASIPHFFFPTPLELHLQHNFRGWIGIAVWAPAILGGMGFMLGADFDDRIERPPSWFMASGLAAAFTPILFGAFIFMLFPHLSTDMAENRPWDELQKALPLYAGIGALQVPFWQGIIQQKLTSKWHPAARIALLIAAEVLIFLPFIRMTNIVDTGFLFVQAAAAGFAAAAYETGLSVKMMMIVRALMGLAFVWFQQALFL